MAEKEDGHVEWRPIIPFFIDTDAYTDRDKEMFCCGYELCMLVTALAGGEKLNKPIHSENESRVRMLASKFHRPVEIVTDVAEGWSNLRTLD